MCEALSIASLTVVYLIFSECIRRCKLKSLCLVFGVVPALLAPVWFWTSELDCFVCLKMFSVFAGICWAGCLRFTNAGRIAAFRRVVPWILLVNVGEAMFVDLWQANIEHLLNALAASMLLVSIPFRSAGVYVERTSGCDDLNYELPRPWIVGYTIWNWSFVLLNYPAYAGHHLAILLAALVVGWTNPNIWLQSRAATLGLSLLCYASNPIGLLSVHNASHWTNCYTVLLVPFLACLWMQSILTRGSMPYWRGPKGFQRITSPSAVA